MGLFRKLFGGGSAKEPKLRQSPPKPSAPGPARPTSLESAPARPAPPAAPSNKGADMVRLAGDGRVSVVGESHYQPALKAAAHGRTVAEGDLDNAIPVNAVLVPEPKNKYDRNAVRVDVEGRTAGYLSRETAVLYQPVLLQLQAESKLGWCPGRIMGGGRRSYGLYLHMSPPERLVCVNLPRDLKILDADRNVTVTGEEKHQDTLESIAAGRDTVAVFASFAPCKIAKGKYAGAEGVEVRIDDERVGELTKAMSDRYGPVVRAVAAGGNEPGCEALVMTSVRGYQVELRMPRQDDLQDES
ncbi:hypothetical protein BH24ACT15_BH24ACT15_38510 [soil metagenome]